MAGRDGKGLDYVDGGGEGHGLKERDGAVIIHRSLFLKEMGGGRPESGRAKKRRENTRK